MIADPLVDLMPSMGLAGPSWDAWGVVAKLLDGLPLDGAERALFEDCTGRPRVPSEPPAELWIIKGRRCGGSRFAGAKGVRAASRQYPNLAPGERAVVSMLAADREQAKVLLGYGTAPFRERGLVERRSGWDVLRSLVTRETQWGVDLRTGVSLEVTVAHYGRARGRSLADANCDEVAFWQREDGSNPASEVFAAIRPALVTLGGQLLVTSSPFAKSGPLWDTYTRYYGVDDDRVMVWRAPSRVMNPLIPERVVLDAMERDEAAARSEWLAEFREDSGALLAHDRLKRIIVTGRTVLEPLPNVDYVAFADVATGSGADEFAWCVAHGEQEPDGRVVVVVDLVEAVKPPFDPLAVTRQCAETLHRYGVASITGDRFAQGWVSSCFDRVNIAYHASARSRSDLYVNFLSIVNQGSVELPDDPRLTRQLMALQRRAGSAGREIVDHPGGAHDDRANVVAGAVVDMHDMADRPEMSWFAS